MKAWQVLKMIEEGQTVQVGKEELTYREGSIGKLVKVGKAEGIEVSNMTLEEFITKIEQNG